MLRRLFLAATVAAVLAGCGGGDSESGAGSDAAPAADPTLAKVYRGPVQVEVKSGLYPFDREVETVPMVVTINDDGTVEMQYDGLGFDGRANGGSFTVTENSTGTSKIGNTTVNTRTEFRATGQVRDDRLSGRLTYNSKFFLTTYRDASFSLPRAM